jgi:CDP-glycerol glycerophosphotransferase (TagB/SpsB family)
MEYKYKFTVVMPVYNVEKYLEESILCVINQDIGFSENIQLILVNDGSTDHSEYMCKKYKEKYPDNIIYIKQENAGVSAARNNGMRYIEGEFVNFLDSDDLWPENAFSRVYKSFEKWNDKIDIVAARIKFFEAKENYHVLDYKFKKDKIVDIMEDYAFIQLSASSAFIRANALKGLEFDTRVKFSEDSKLLCQILFEKKKYGVLKSLEYKYRKRLDNTSAIQISEKSKSWCFDTTNYVYKYIIEYSKEKLGFVLPYVQYFVMYDLQWRLKSSISFELNAEERKRYKEVIIELLQNIDDYIILEQRNLWREFKVYALCLKYGRDITEEYRYNHGKFLFNNLVIESLDNKKKVVAEFFNVNKNKLVLEGYINLFLPTGSFELFFETNNGEKYKAETFGREKHSRIAFDEQFYQYLGFKVTIPSKKVKTIRAVIKYREYERIVRINFGKFAKINSEISESYFISKKSIIKYKKNKIKIYKRSAKKHLKSELSYQKQLFQLKEYQIMFVRILYIFITMFMSKFGFKKEIWLLSDRLNVANDNAEHLFKYILKQNNTKISPYFVISKDSPDYQRLKKMGKVINNKSFKYKLFFLLSSKVISSHADEFIINAFDKKREYVKDLYKFKYIFLQHGVIKEDLSDWLNKYNKNISVFVTSGKEEYRSLLTYDYYYNENIVKLTGLPRFDNLQSSKNERKQSILIIPTWRQYLAGPLDQNKNRTYNEKFKESQYFSFYNCLINDPKLKNALEKYHYKAKFCLHPALSIQVNDFVENDYVKVERKPVDYQFEFKANSLLVTDYSSVFFDFAYLKKPVIYTHFDKDIFYENHLYSEGYFSYERDGFGPVYYDYDSTLNGIIKMIENNCVMDEKYLQRAENFYYKFDTNNCKRVYDEILKLK